MSRRLFARIAVPAVVLAALVLAPVAWALPRPPLPPPPRPAGPPLMFRPAHLPGGHFARPSLLARPNVGRAPSLTGRRPGHWAPSAVNRRWGRPTATLGTGRSKVNRGNTSSKRRPDHGRGDYGLHHSGPRYGWVGSYSYPSGYPDYGGGDPYSGSYPSDGSDLSSGSLSAMGTTDSSYPPAEPAPVPSVEDVASTDKEAAVERRMELARRAFHKGDQAEAQRQCEESILLLPSDANLNEFRALCQFAQGRYKDAAATLYEVLATKPVWDWNTLSSFYTSAGTYTRQLRALERHVRENPKDAVGHFVLAYHYLALEDLDATVGQLREVVKLQPRDKVSPALLEALEKLKDGDNVAPAR